MFSDLLWWLFVFNDKPQQCPKMITKRIMKFRSNIVPITLSDYLRKMPNFLKTVQIRNRTLYTNSHHRLYPTSKCQFLCNSFMYCIYETIIVIVAWKSYQSYCSTIFPITSPTLLYSAIFRTSCLASSTQLLVGSKLWK